MFTLIGNPHVDEMKEKKNWTVRFRICITVDNISAFTVIMRVSLFNEDKKSPLNDFDRAVRCGWTKSDMRTEASNFTKKNVRDFFFVVVTV